MANGRSPKVDEFIAHLPHARTTEIEHLRNAILDSSADITERIKWNAPSFCCDGDDRVTLRLQPGDRVELIFHRGAKKRHDVAGFTFADPSGLITFVTPDRGVVALADLADTEGKTPAIVGVVEAWMRATRDG